MGRPQWSQRTTEAGPERCAPPCRRRHRQQRQASAHACHLPTTNRCWPCPRLCSPTRPPRCPHHPPLSVGSPCSQPNHLPAAGVEPTARCCQSWPSQFGDQIRFAQRPTTLQKNWSYQLHTSATPVSTPPEEPRTGVKLLCARLERAHQFFPVHSPCNDNARDGALHQQSAHQRSTAKSRSMSTKRHSQ